MITTGHVVKITSKRHKYFDHIAVVLYATPKMLTVKLLDLKKELYQRFCSTGNKVTCMTGEDIFFYISPTSVQDTNKKMKVVPNAWHKDTLKLLDKFSGKTIKEVEKIIGHKLVPWK